MSNLLIADSAVLTFLKVCVIAGLAVLAILGLVMLIMPKKTLKAIFAKIKAYFVAHKNIAEILRFLIVGGIATVFDMFFMGVVMYFMQKNIYPSFLNVFINQPDGVSVLANVVGTTIGSIVGLIINYVLSILFVFNEKGKSKSVLGFIIFSALTFIGLGINMLGTWIGCGLLHLNTWLVKIIMVIIVLIYNYISKRLLLFKNKKKASVDNQTSETIEKSTTQPEEDSPNNK